MSISLDEALVEEKSIFRRFNSSEIISDTVEVFYSADSEEVPHWNAAYAIPSKHSYSKQEFQRIREFYRQVEKQGHFFSIDNQYSSQSAESSEYFVLEKNLIAKNNELDIASFSSPKEEDLAKFCHIVGEAFEFNKETIEYFRKKMEILKEKVTSNFLVISFQDEPVGTCSTFRTDNDMDFLFNVAVLPKVQGENIGSRMLQYVATVSKSPLLTYSHNSAMRTKILPLSGFQSLGTVHAVPLEYWKGED